MSIPRRYITDLLNKLSISRIENLIAQTDARRILQEVRESAENYPHFDHALTEKASFIAYALLSCGCSMIENNNSNENEGIIILEKAGKILSDAYKFNSNEMETREYNLLIAGMALYASKQYSRAFFILNDIYSDFAVAQLIIMFIKKDFKNLLKYSMDVFLSEKSEVSDVREFDEWVITHEIAHCFIIVLDFVNSGNHDDFRRAEGILDKLLLLAIQSDLTLFWLIVRLLKIIFSNFSSSSLWSVLPPFLPDDFITAKYIRLLGCFKSPVTEIWPSQEVALSLAIGDNSGAVVNLRTSGGKTRVAEIAILKAISENNMSKVLYLAPFRSLAFEMEQSLSKIFEPIGITVSQLYGGSTVNITDFELISRSHVIIATPEKAKALIRCGSGIESEIKLIVVDEGHLLGAEERYIKNEIFLTHLKGYSVKNQIRMLLLSAVLPNANELAEWIADDSNSVAKSEWKPALERLGVLLWDGNSVRLEWKSDGEPFNPNFVHKQPLGFGKRRTMFPNDKKEAIAATAVRLAQTGTVMIYSARANSIEGLARSVLLALGSQPDDFSWDQTLWDIFETVCIEELGDEDIVLKAAKKGVICHNNRLPTLVRIAIERLMRSQPPLVIIASSTLGQGVNIGISTVIVSTPYYSDEAISNRDFWNICGRAGRAFSDAEGKILYAIDTTEEKWKVKKNKRLAQDYFDNHHMEPAQSGLHIALKAICGIAKKTATNVELLIEAIANDFSDTDAYNYYVDKLNKLFDYIDDEILAMHEDFDEDDSLNWVDTVFRTSLAVIQAEATNKDYYLKIVKSRATALLNRIPNKQVRKKLIATGIPLSISRKILEDADIFRSLATTYMQSCEIGDNVEAINEILREIEIWVKENAHTIVKEPPDQADLDAIRTHWISGEPLVRITDLSVEADKITKDFYGFSMPWIIHAVSQMFDSESEKNIVQAYASIAMFVELGLPNMTAVSIYLAGVRSRSAALEFSTYVDFADKKISEIKQILMDFYALKKDVTDSAKCWLTLFYETERSYTPKIVSFPVFTWEKDGLPDKLSVAEVKGEYFLVSCDGYFYERVDSTKELPFSKLVSLHGVHFTRKNSEWHLESYNPMITVVGQ